MERVIDIALANGVAAEAEVYPRNREEYEHLREREIQLFGRFRNSEYDLLSEAAGRAMSIYR